MIFIIIFKLITVNDMETLNHLVDILNGVKDLFLFSKEHLPHFLAIPFIGTKNPLKKEKKRKKKKKH